MTTTKKTPASKKIIPTGPATGSRARNVGHSATWMQDTMSVIGDKRLSDICITGSHDAGMSKRTGGTAMGLDCNTLTQTQGIRAQLENGARYFDIRPVITGKGFATGHYAFVNKITWQGANGESIQSIIDAVNDFTSRRQELVILYLSLSLNTVVGNSSYRPFNQSEWDDLFNKLTRINHRFHTSENNIQELTLRSLIGDSSAVLIIVQNSGDYDLKLGAYRGKGFFLADSFPVYDKYTHTNEFEKMKRDQFEKMRVQSPQHYFLLSWTLTQSDLQAVTCGAKFSDSILTLAKKANKHISTIPDNISRTVYPNIIYVDDYPEEATAAAVRINEIVHG